MKRLTLLMLPLALAFLIGCGGGSSNSATGRVAFKVIWPEKTRLIPQATQSIRVRLEGPNNYDQQAILQRSEGQTEATRDWRDLQPGQYTLHAEAYPNDDASGVILASGSAGVMVEAGVNKQVVVVMNSTIVRIELKPETSTIPVGGQVQLTATAYDAQDNVVLLTPGRLEWSYGSPDGIVYVDPNGLVTGHQIGDEIVRATDMESGVHSNPAIIEVTAVGEPRFFMTTAYDGWLLVSTPDPFTQALSRYMIGAFMVSVAVDQEGRIYVVDRGANRVIRMNDSMGSAMMEYGSQGTGVGQFSDPSDVYIDPQGRILIADTGNGRIVRIDDMTGAGWVEYGYFESPVSVCTDLLGRIYVADSVVDTLVRVDDMQGTNHAVQALAHIEAVRVARSGRIYALRDTGDGSMLSLLDDVPATAAISSRDVVDGRRIAIDSQGRIYLTRVDGRLERFDANDWSSSSDTPICVSPEQLWGIAIYDPSPP